MPARKGDGINMSVYMCETAGCDKEADFEIFDPEGESCGFQCKDHLGLYLSRAWDSSVKAFEIRKADWLDIRKRGTI